jgi:hypothetical protein
MKKLMLAITFVLAVAFLFTAGCTQTPTTPGASATPTPVSTPVPVQTTNIPKTLPTSGMGTPGPTVVLPPDYSLEFQITGNGDTSNPMMSVSIRGGNGMNLDSQVDVSLTTPDGAVQQKSMFPPFSMGQQVVFPCSTTQNRVEIWVTAPQVGKVKVYDDYVPFKNINP